MPLSATANAETFRSVDTAPNDRFSESVTIEPGVTRLFGQLEAPESSEFVYEATGTLTPGEVDTLTISDLPPSQPVVIYLEPSSDRTSAILGLFDSEDTLVNYG